MNIDELERLAREATAGPYFVHAALGYAVATVGKTRVASDVHPKITQEQVAADAAYIAAASPDVMAKLIAVVRAAQTVETTSGTSITALCVLSVALAALKATP
jgi:hypothetical protein